MKRILIFLAMLLLAAILFGMPTGKSVFFADSYMLRASGVEANYWNPAALAESKYIDLWLPGLNSGAFAANNAFDLDTYNYIVGRDTLNLRDKEMILGKMDNSFRGRFSASLSAFGITMGNTAISSSIHYYGKASLSKRLLEVALYGNQESEYHFNKSDTYVSGIAYNDITYGMGGYKIPYLPEGFPEIKTGVSFSILTGIYNVQTRYYEGSFSSDVYSGINLNQEAIIRKGAGGFGFKAMVGVQSDITPKLKAGITLDNIFGRINWNLMKEDVRYKITADSIYIYNLEDDFYETVESSSKIGAYDTHFAPEMRMAVLYKLPYVDVSADWLQAFRESSVTDATGSLSLGLSAAPHPALPLSLGLSFGNSSRPYSISYGFGLKSKTNEIGFGIQSYDSMIPGMKSKGISVASSIRIWF